MNVKIIHTESKWDYKKKEIYPYSYTLNGTGLNKTQVKSLVRFVRAGMTSSSVGNKGVKTVDELVEEAIMKGSSCYRLGEYDSIEVEIEKGA